MQTLRIAVQGVDLEVRQSSGTGAPAVCFHGNSGSAALYDALLDSELGRRHRLLAVSFPGHGDSAPGPADGSLYSIPALGGVAAAVVDALGVKRPVLVGHSMGGHSLLEAINQFPGARGLLLLSAPPLNLGTMPQAFKPDPSKGALFAQDLDEAAATALAACFLARAEGQSLDALTGAIRATDPAFRPALLASLMRGELRDELAALNMAPCPVGLVAGGADQFLEPAYFDGLPVARLWRNQVHVVAGCGHAVHVEAPDAVAALLGQFLADLDAG